MKIQTIHTSAIGDVLNESSATGFRITNADGHSVELRIENDVVSLKTGKHKTVLMVGASAAITGKQFTGIVVDDLMPPRKQVCYDCYEKVTWLAPDGRCASCTRMTPDEVTGSAPD
jgi:hypothetical protein